MLVNLSAFGLGQERPESIRWQVVNSFGTGEGETLSNQAFNPEDSFAIYIDACDLVDKYVTFTPSSYDWYLDNKVSLSPTHMGTTETCYVYTSLKEGTHNLFVQFPKPTTTTTTMPEIIELPFEINLEHTIIAAMGDSFASGEGSPDRPIDFERYEAYRAAVEDYQKAQNDLQESLTKLLELEELSEGLGELNTELLTRLEGYDFETHQTALNNSFLNLVESCVENPKDLNDYFDGCNVALKDSIVESSKFLNLAALLLGEYGQDFSDELLTYLEMEFADSEAFLNSLQLTQENLNAFATDCINVEEQAEQRRFTVIGILRCTKRLQPFANSIASSVSEFGELSYREILEFGDELSLVFATQFGPEVGEKAQEGYESLVAAYELVDSSRRQLSNAASLIEDLIGGAQATWQDDVCHRSLRSSTVQFARRLQQENPHKAVSLINVSCSGASINKGLLAPHRGKASQLDQLKTTLAGQKADILLLSIGGNDIGFTKVLRTCALLPKCYEFADNYQPELIEAEITEAELTEISDQCAVILWDKFADAATIDYYFNECLAFLDVDSLLEVPQASEVVLPKLAALPQSLQALAVELEQVVENSNDVYVIEYLDPTKDEAGVHCGYDRWLERQFPGLSREEMTWADEAVLQQLNATLANAASVNNWNYIGGIYENTRLHGYCSTDTWIQRLQDSFYVQGDAAGVMHPNDRGQAFIADVIYNAIQ